MAPRTEKSSSAGRAFYSFPRSAWERTAGRSASRPAQELDAERRGVRSHAERGNEDNRSYYSFPLYVLGALLVISSAGCQQKMAEQPSYRPLRPSEFFDDGRSARPLVPGTVPYSAEPDRPALVTGRVPNAESSPTPLAEFVTAFPFPLTKADVERGRERFTIFCALCHDAAGTGHGKIVERGYTMPPSYHTGFSRGLGRRGVKMLLRDAPVGYYFEVISKGYGAMPDYAAQVPPEDRWRIIAYIRALQYSRHVPLEDLTEEERRKVVGD